MCKTILTFGKILTLLIPALFIFYTNVAIAQNIDVYCKRQFGESSSAILLDRNNAYSWRCLDGTRQAGVNVEALCQQQFGVDEHAKMLNKNDAYSWRCVTNSERQQFDIAASSAKEIGLDCAVKSNGQLTAFIACANQQVILPKTEQLMVDCAANSGGDTDTFALCIGSDVIDRNINEEQKIAIQCISETNGQPYAAAACTASRLTARELAKCLTNGFGGPNGCFGDNNDLTGQNGWTARSFSNVVSDIQHGAGPTNDLVGKDGFVQRKVEDIQSDIQNGPGPHNDIVGCDGFVNKMFGGGC